MEAFKTVQLPVEEVVIAPDGSQIRLLPTLEAASMVHCQLETGKTTYAVRHRTVSEMWYVLAGEGQIWRKQGDQESVTALRAGVALTIPLGTHFQFRATGDDDLQIVIVTLPPWPGHDEAVRVKDYWSPDV